MQTLAKWDQGTVTALLQSHTGYLWVASYHGLARFDGVRFTLFDRSNCPELPNGLITALYESPDGVLWIGHETGHLTRLQRGKFHQVPFGREWPGGSVEAITTDEAGDLWLLSNAGILFRLRDGSQVLVPGGASASNKPMLSRGAHGVNWFMAGGKLSLLEHGQIRSCDLPADAGDDFYELVAPARDGALWVATSQSLRKWSHGRWVALPESFARPQGTITALFETRSGVLLVGTLKDGLYLLRTGAPAQHFDFAGGLSHNWIRCVCEDREGDLWLGTGAGLDKLRTRSVQSLAAPDSWKGCGVLSFAIEADGSAWVGTEGAGLYRFERGLWSSCDTGCGLSNSFVWSVLSTHDHQLLVGTWGGGLFERVAGRFEVPPGLAEISSPVTSLYEGEKGEIWIGTTTGLYRYEAGRITWSAGADKLVLPDVRAITETADGALWFGMSGGGLGSLKDGNLRQYLQNSGLGSDYVLCLLPERGNVLWIGSADHGLTRLKDGKFSAIGPRQGLPSSVIYHLVDDQAGNLWMGSQAGILCASKAELNRCADGLSTSVLFRVYGQAEGLSARSCSGGFQPGACRSADGRLWFPTPKGVAIIDPANIRTNPVPPPVLIEEVLADGQALPITPALLAAGPVEIPPGKRRIGFRYTALSFAVPEKVRFQHKLEGIESEWVQAGTARSVEYNLLSPGTYTFRVIGCNNDGVWNREGATVAVTLLPYFWQTWWFHGVSLLGGAVLVVSGALSASRRRHLRHLEQVEKQRSLERERARIARDIHDDLGASLTRISLLSQSIRGEIERPDLGAEVDQIYATARQLTRAMDEIVWAVNPKHDTVDSLVTYLGRFAQQFLTTAGLRCRLDVPMQLPAWPLTSEIRHNVYLALKEILNNVVRHAAATEVRISLELMPSGFTLLVVDNGQGFRVEPGAEPHSEISVLAPGAADIRVASGNGLLNIRKRLGEIGAQCAWETAPGEGTRFRVFVPVPIATAP